MMLMMEEIKKVTMEHIREHKDASELDIGEFFRTLQSKIITQFCVGGERAYNDDIDYEKEDGTIEKMKLMFYLDCLMKDSAGRAKSLLVFIFPWLLNYTLPTPYD